MRQEDDFIIYHNGGKFCIDTTKGWEILIHWKDGSSSWETFKYIKNYYPVHMAEYADQKRISEETECVWWVTHVMNKKERIIFKVKSN